MVEKRKQVAGVFAVLLLTAVCAALYYFSLQRTGDWVLASFLALAVFAAFVLGSIVHPLAFSSKKLARTSLLAAQVGQPDASHPPLDQQSLDDLPNISLPGQGHIDEVAAVEPNGAVHLERSPVIRRGDEVVLEGWAVDPVAQAPAGGLFLIVDGLHRVDESSQYGLIRQDIPHALNNPDLLHSGYRIVLDGAKLRAGKHLLEIGIIAADQRGFFELPDRVSATVTEP